MSSKWKIHKRKKVAKEDLIRDFNYSGIELEESGLYGLDDEPATLAGIETMDNIDFTEDYDMKPESNLDPDETHIFYGDSPEEQERKKEEEAKAKKEPPYDPKRVIKHKIPPIGKSVKDYQRKKSGQNFRKMILDFIDLIPHTVNYCVEYAMYHYCYFAYKNSKDWPAYEQAHADACATIMRLITVPLAAIVVLNWWYLLNYTDFYIDTDKIFDSFPLSALHTILNPTAQIIGGINNFLVGMRVLENTSETTRSFYKKLWDYRPITIAVFFLFVYGILRGVGITDVLKSAILGKPNTIFYSIIGLSILLYLFNLMDKTAAKWMTTYPNVILVGILALLCLIGVILVSFVGVFIVFYYFIFFSIFFIFVYNGFNLAEVMKIVKTIIEDINFSGPFFSEETLAGKIASTLLRNICTIFFYLSLSIIGFYGYIRGIMNLKWKYDFPTNMMRLFYSLFVVYGIWELFSIFKFVWKLVNSKIEDVRETVKENLDGNSPLSETATPIINVATLPENVSSIENLMGKMADIPSTENLMGKMAGVLPKQ